MLYCCSISGEFICLQVNWTVASTVVRVSNTPGNLLELFFAPGNLLEIYKVSWKFSGLVCKFEHLSLISVTVVLIRVCQYKISLGKSGSIDIEVSNLGNCQLTHLLIG